MSTTQTLTEQAHDEETTPKPKTRVTKKKMITFDQKTTKDVVFKKKDEDFQRKVLGLTIPDIAPKEGYWQGWKGSDSSKETHP